MVNIILISNGSRRRLLEQTLRTLRDNTPSDPYTLTIVCDGSVVSVEPIARHLSIGPENASAISVNPACHIIGRLKNLGAYWSEKQFGRGEYICFLDDDMAMYPGWLEKMQTAFQYDSRIALVGGCRHPYHGVNKSFGFERNKDACFELTDAVAGYCHFMRWSTWDKFGTYDAHAMGTGQSEDYALSRKIVDDGGRVGYIHPPCMIHAGITNSEGKPAIGMESVKRVPGLIYE